MTEPPGLDLLHSFRVVAEELSFRSAAARLNLDQSALSRRVQRLETLLGFRLMERTTRQVTLTEAGRLFLRENAALLGRYDETVAAARRVAEGKTGALHVAYMAFAATRLMPETVARFRAARPHVDVTLSYLRTQGQKLALAQGEIDLGFLIGPYDHPDFATAPLAAEPLSVIARADHPLMRGAAVAPADLRGVGLVLGDMAEWGAYRLRLADLFGEEGVALDVRMEASNTLALLGLVAAGLGVTVYPESLAPFLGGGLAARPIASRRFRSETVLAWRRADRGEAVRAFVAAARAASRPPADS